MGHGGHVVPFPLERLEVIEACLLLSFAVLSPQIPSQSFDALKVRQTLFHEVRQNGSQLKVGAGLNLASCDFLIACSGIVSVSDAPPTPFGNFVQDGWIDIHSGPSFVRPGTDRRINRSPAHLKLFHSDRSFDCLFPGVQTHTPPHRS